MSEKVPRSPFDVRRMMTNALDLAQMVEDDTIPPFVYTYPPRSAYVPVERPATTEHVWASPEAGSSDDLNVYIHVPFCDYRCGFCNLYTLVEHDDVRKDAYVQALRSQLEMHRRALESRRVATVFVGGGTPTTLGAERLKALFAWFDLATPSWRSEVEEVCVEATPDSLRGSVGRALLDILVSSGVTRINMGVQSLDDAELDHAGRGQASVAVVEEAFVNMRDARVANISTDLIIGFEGQTAESWIGSVRRLLELSPDTISTYFLSVRPDAPFARQGYRYHREKLLWRRYDEARELIRSRGFVQESNVRYKIAGRGGYRQKVLQFRGVPTLGVGAGSRSYTDSFDYLIGGGYPSAKSQIDEYVRSVESGTLNMTAGFRFTPDERVRKRLALDATCPQAALEPLGFEPDASYVRAIEDAVSLGLLRRHASRLSYTEQGVRHRDAISWAMASPLVLKRSRAFYSDLHASQVVLRRSKSSAADASGIPS